MFPDTILINMEGKIELHIIRSFGMFTISCVELVTFGGDGAEFCGTLYNIITYYVYNKWTEKQINKWLF